MTKPRCVREPFLSSSFTAQPAIPSGPTSLTALARPGRPPGASVVGLAQLPLSIFGQAFWKEEEWAPTQNHTTQCPTFLSSLGPYSRDPAADSSAGQALAGQGHRESGGWRYCITSGWCWRERRAGPQKDGVWALGEELRAGTLVGGFSALSPEPRNPVSPPTTPVHSEPPCLCEIPG